RNCIFISAHQKQCNIFEWTNRVGTTF
ncbi:hypothetical protein TorRG33x02_225280, partial [Trema orientale]